MPALKSYPYPVLGNNDDIEGEFTFSIVYTLEKKDVLIECKFSLDHPYIEKLIDEKKAVFQVEVQCSATFFRESYYSETSRRFIILPAENLRNVVKIEAFICANVDLPNYYPEGIHPDLQGDPFQIEPGDVLALGGITSFPADKEFDPLRAPISSFMKVQKGNFNHGPINVDYGGDQIVIYLSEEDYVNYCEMRDFAAGNLHSAVVLPVLIDAIHLIDKNENDYSDQPWCVKLSEICNRRGLDTNEAFETAQRILDNPVSRNFRNIKSIMATDLE